MCLSKDKQRKKRRCPSCQKKYSSFILNVTLAEVVERVGQRREWMEGQSRRCDECESRRPVVAMRRCVTCVRDIGRHVSRGCTLDCVICLECCVDRHNGHELIPVGPPASCSRTTLPPVASSTPRVGTPRYVPWRACTSKDGESNNKGCVELRPPTRAVNGDRPRAPITASIIDEELVIEARSPLYYHLTSPLPGVVPNKIGVVQRLSGIIRSIASSRTSITSSKDSKRYQSACCGKDSSTSTGPTFSDSSLYQRISPPRPKNLQRMTCASDLVLGGVQRQPLSHYYVNLPRRHSD
ncbi:hypothetical protein Y032_0003g1349 [Ancylostoma ceylanicum]|uniref:Uncharacterized protein n=1 Tax=Ancylostoma ceylanicum TaxID=53326 RepID=A0A016VYB6_9BILA|nr:hypothetical protein Y032_0003g1349 [Ancylostoma ceylanicum]